MCDGVLDSIEKVEPPFFQSFCSNPPPKKKSDPGLVPGWELREGVSFSDVWGVLLLIFLFFIMPLQEPAVRAGHEAYYSGGQRGS